MSKFDLDKLLKDLGVPQNATDRQTAAHSDTGAVDAADLTSAQSSPDDEATTSPAEAGASAPPPAADSTQQHATSQVDGDELDADPSAPNLVSGDLVEPAHDVYLPASESGPNHESPPDSYLGSGSGPELRSSGGQTQYEPTAESQSAMGATLPVNQPPTDTGFGAPVPGEIEEETAVNHKAESASP
ncbi:MAG: hypothetical protein ACOC0P_06410, partial [Planctomycetota bacterium]